MKVRSLDEVNPVEVRSATTGEIFTISRTITDGSAIGSFVVRHEDLGPGRRTSSPHAHSRKDELYYVLSGTPTVIVNGERRLMQAGEFVAFKGGLKEVHHLTNETDEKVALLLVSSCCKDDEIEYAS